jgi:hypothetical protein
VAKVFKRVKTITMLGLMTIKREIRLRDTFIHTLTILDTHTGYCTAQIIQTELDETQLPRLLFAHTHTMAGRSSEIDTVSCGNRFEAVLAEQPWSVSLDDL